MAGDPLVDVPWRAADFVSSDEEEERFSPPLCVLDPRYMAPELKLLLDAGVRGAKEKDWPQIKKYSGCCCPLEICVGTSSTVPKTAYGSTLFFK